MEQQGKSSPKRWWRRTTLAVVVGLTAGAIGIVSVAASGPPEVPKAVAAPAPAVAVLGEQVTKPVANDGWGEPWFVDNFSGPALDTTRWFSYDTQTVEPKRDKALVRVANDELQLVGSVNAAGQEIGSGIAGTFGQMYGRWEARFRIDRGAGYGPVILLWPDGAGKWPKDGEIDLMEIPAAARSWGTTVAHNGSPDRYKSQRVTADFTKWHTVAVDWLPDHLTFFLDGKELWTVTPATKPYDGSKRNLVPSTSPMRLALQLDECSHNAPGYGPKWIPCRNKQTPPEVALHIDWVKIYKAP